MSALGGKQTLDFRFQRLDKRRSKNTKNPNIMITATIVPTTQEYPSKHLHDYRCSRLMGCVTTSTPTAEQRAYCTRMAEQMGTATTHDHSAMKGMPASPMNMTHEQCQRLRARQGISIFHCRLLARAIGAVAILSAAQTILDFKTKAARDIEGGRIKSIIDPRLADHVRREALKFVDELKRA